MRIIVIGLVIFGASCTTRPTNPAPSLQSLTIPTLTAQYADCFKFARQHRMNEELISALFMELTAVKNAAGECQEGVLDGVQDPSSMLNELKENEE